jgi:hypothetical protein
LFGDNILDLGPSMQKLALLVEALFTVSKGGTKLGSTKISLQSSTIRQAVQVHLTNRLQCIRILCIRYKRRDAIGLHAFRRCIETDFGKFGTISRICFNTSPKCVKANSIPTFVTYTKDADALQAIRKMNLYCLADGTRLKTNFGRTKFCPAFTHGEKCLNEKCKFLHRWAKVEDIITEQEISDFNAIRAGPPSRYSRR